MDIKERILGAMAGVASATASDVALYVDPAMLRTGLDGVARLLPVIAVAGGGYARFTGLDDEAAEHFGALLAVAEIRVEQLNREYGLEPDDAAAIIAASFERVTG